MVVTVLPGSTKYEIQFIKDVYFEIYKGADCFITSLVTH